jgi:hypothetical protein
MKRKSKVLEKEALDGILAGGSAAYSIADSKNNKAQPTRRKPCRKLPNGGFGALEGFVRYEIKPDFKQTDDLLKGL